MKRYWSPLLALLAIASMVFGTAYAVRDEPRNEALPRQAASGVSVQPEAVVACAQDVARADRVRLRRHP